MSLEVPKLLQSDTADIDNVIALGDGGLGVVSLDVGAQREDEPRQRLVQGEQAEVLGSDLGRCCLRILQALLVV